MGQSGPYLEKCIQNRRQPVTWGQDWPGFLLQTLEGGSRKVAALPRSVMQLFLNFKSNLRIQKAVPHNLYLIAHFLFTCWVVLVTRSSPGLCQIAAGMRGQPVASLVEQPAAVVCRMGSGVWRSCAGPREMQVLVPPAGRE